MSIDRDGRGSSTEAGGDGLSPIEVIPASSQQERGAPGGVGSGGSVRVSFRGGTARVGGKGCARAGCCVGWVALLGFGFLVGVVWLVKAIWVRL